MQEVISLFDRSRLVSLVGIGGIGKTRLAIHVAHSMSMDFFDGSLFVDLSSATPEHPFLESISEQLRESGQSEHFRFKDVSRSLHQKSILMVMDKCGSIEEEDAILIERLLNIAPHLRILTTSRQSLNLLGESIFTFRPSLFRRLPRRRWSNWSCRMPADCFWNEHHPYRFRRLRTRTRLLLERYAFIWTASRCQSNWRLLVLASCLY
jgi:hypothetical protein